MTHHAFNGCTHWRASLKPHQIPVLGLQIRVPPEHEVREKAVFTAVPRSLHALVRDPRLCLTALENWIEEEACLPHWTGEPPPPPKINK